MSDKPTDIPGAESDSIWQLYERAKAELTEARAEIARLENHIKADPKSKLFQAILAGEKLLKEQSK